MDRQYNMCNRWLSHWVTGTEPWLRLHQQKWLVFDSAAFVMFDLGSSMCLSAEHVDDQHVKDHIDYKSRIGKRMPNESCEQNENKHFLTVN